MAIHSSILAWKIPWTQESGGLQSTGSQWVRKNWSDLVGSTSLLDESVLSQFYILFCITESKEMNRLFREVEKSLPCSTDTSNSKYFNECVFCISLLCNYPMANKFPFCDLFFICIILSFRPVNLSFGQWLVSSPLYLFR